MRMLAMQVDQVDTLLGEGADRRKVPVDVHATAPFARDDPTDNEFVVAELESALNLGLGRTRTHERRVGPTAGEKVDRADDRVLPAPVSPVTTVIPPSRTSDSSSMTPRSRTNSSVSTPPRERA